MKDTPSFPEACRSMKDLRVMREAISKELIDISAITNLSEQGILDMMKISDEDLLRYSKWSPGFIQAYKSRNKETPAHLPSKVRMELKCRVSGDLEIPDTISETFMVKSCQGSLVVATQTIPKNAQLFVVDCRTYHQDIDYYISMLSNCLKHTTEEYITLVFLSDPAEEYAKILQATTEIEANMSVRNGVLLDGTPDKKSKVSHGITMVTYVIINKVSDEVYEAHKSGSQSLPEPILRFAGKHGLDNHYFTKEVHSDKQPEECVEELEYKEVGLKGGAVNKHRLTTHLAYNLVKTFVPMGGLACDYFVNGWLGRQALANGRKIQSWVATEEQKEFLELYYSDVEKKHLT